MIRHSVFVLLILALLLLPGAGRSPAIAQGNGDFLCVHAPAEIARGNTEAIEIEIDLATPTPEGWTCTALSEVQADMGAGIHGTGTNFLLDPIADRETATVQNPGSNQWNWAINAIGEENTSHNLIVYAYVPDASRATGIRSVARIALRLTILPPSGTIFDQIMRFVNNAKELLLVLSAAIVAVIALRNQIAGLFKGGGGSTPAAPPPSQGAGSG